MAVKKTKSFAQKNTNPKPSEKSGSSSGFIVTSKFSGYRSKEDLTNLPPGFLVPPSQNVVTNTEGLVQTAAGYSLDGQAGTSGSPIVAYFDWNRGLAGERNIRAGNSKIQYRYVANGGDKWNANTFTQGQVYWIDLLTSQTINESIPPSFCTFFDFTTEKSNFLLMVNHSAAITEWSGGVATIKSSTSNTLTLNGLLTWANLGFYTTTSPRSIVINGNTYTYTGGETTTTLTGVSGDPTGEALNSIVHQLPITTSNQPASGFINDIIGNLGNQVYVASTASNIIYLSKINNYKDYTQSSPRLPGDGYTAAMDGLINTIKSQENVMYVSWGISGWTLVNFTLSADLTKEAVSFTPLKTAPLQAALSHQLTENIGNDLSFITNEPTLSTLGRVSQTITTPQFSNLSDTIKNDMDIYGTASFLGGNVKYSKYFVYVSMPILGKWIKYNLAMGWWEAPRIAPIRGFSIIGGLIYGHSSQTDETYKLENGTNDNGNVMHAIAAFSYDNFNDRARQELFNEFYVEGYISGNTILNVITKFDFGGFSGAPVYQISGADGQIIFQTSADGSLGKSPLGEMPIGSITDSPANLPKFRVIKTSIPTSFFEYQAYFETNDIDQQWQILGFGPRVQIGAAPTQIRE